MVRIRCCLALVVAATVVLGPCAYLEGLWPQHLEFTVEGPPSWRLVRIDGRACDDALPEEVSKDLGIGATWREVDCKVEISDGVDRARARVRALDMGCYLSGHTAAMTGIDSLDGSLWLKTWLRTDWAVTATPAVAGRVWFGSEAWAPRTIRVDGSAGEEPSERPFSTSLSEGVEHTLESEDWKLTLVADAGTVVHLSEWGSPERTVLRCDESGFATATLSVDEEPARPIDLSQPMEFGPLVVLDLRLESADGRRAQVRLLRRRELQLTLRVSR
jgi:hypothetical protein